MLDAFRERASLRFLFPTRLTQGDESCRIDFIDHLLLLVIGYAYHDNRCHAYTLYEHGKLFGLDGRR